MPIRFRVRWIPFIATVIVAAIGMTLGQWQTSRGDEKEQIQAKLVQRQAAPAVKIEESNWDIEELEYRYARFSGEFIPQWVIYLENRPYNGVPGFYVLMPFTIAGANKVVLVARGWVPRDMHDRTKLPSISTPVGIVEIEGVIRRNVGHVLQLGQIETPRPGAIMQNLDMSAYAQASQFRLAPFVVEQVGDFRDGLVRDWPTPSLGIERHRGYAVQWYALATMAILFFVVTGLRNGKK